MRITTLRSRGVWLRSLALSAAMLAALGCGGDKGTGPGSNPAGSYVLQEIDDFALPVTIHNGPWLDPVHVTFYNLYNMRITGGVIELGSDDRFSFTLNGSVNADGIQWEPTMYVVGDYGIDDGEIWFEPDDQAGNTLWATIDRGNISFDLDVMSKGAVRDYVFRR